MRTTYSHILAVCLLKHLLRQISENVTDIQFTVDFLELKFYLYSLNLIWHKTYGQKTPRKHWISSSSNSSSSSSSSRSQLLHYQFFITLEKTATQYKFIDNQTANWSLRLIYLQQRYIEHFFNS